MATVHHTERGTHVTTNEFDAFYQATRGRVVAALYALTGDLSEAQDVTQEAYARAWQRWGSVGTYGDPEAWVRTVARRIAYSGWRKARNRITAYRRHGSAAHTPAPSEDTVALVTALRQLSPEQREAIVLHHIVGLPVEEVARQTGAPAGTVKTRLSRGRRALSELLQVEVPEVSYA
ncbi:MAG: SigE family RNA polymerase sigma factor [Micromonosporaceae bacterium]